jgi:hypothetical protein
MLQRRGAVGTAAAVSGGGDEAGADGARLPATEPPSVLIAQHPLMPPALQPPHGDPVFIMGGLNVGCQLPTCERRNQGRPKSERDKSPASPARASGARNTGAYSWRGASKGAL